MRILVTNDDGIYSPGLAALAEVAGKFGEVRIVAPDVEQSAMSHAVTHSSPLSYRPAPRVLQRTPAIEAFKVNGTPADCVALGLYHWEGADAVLSGINLGANLGHAMWHSGTLAGAKQAALLDVQAIAFSCDIGDDEQGLEQVLPCAEQILQRVLGDPRLELLNVNFPAEPPKGILWTHQSVRHYHGKIVPQTDPAGREQFWFLAFPRGATDEYSDRWAVERGYASITPIRLDLTDRERLSEMKNVGIFKES